MLKEDVSMLKKVIALLLTISMVLGNYASVQAGQVDNTNILVESIDETTVEDGVEEDSALLNADAIEILDADMNEIDLNDIIEKDVPLKGEAEANQPENIAEGIAFSQIGVDEDYVVSDPKYGVTEIHIIPEENITQFTLMASAFRGESDQQKSVPGTVNFTTSDKKVADIKINNNNSLTVNIKSEGVATITGKAKKTDGSVLSQDVRITVIDYTPRLYEKTITLNTLMNTPSGYVTITPAYENIPQCQLLTDSMKLVYRDSNGNNTDSEFDITPLNKENTFRISLKNESNTFTGTKRVYIEVPVHGLGVNNIENYYLPLSIKLSNIQPKLRFETKAINPFYKDSQGTVTVLTDGAEIEKIDFIPDTKDGKAGLIASSNKDIPALLTVSANNVLNSNYTKKYNSKGTLKVYFKDYKDSAARVFKNYKLPTDNTLPKIAGSTKELTIYTDKSNMTKAYLLSGGEIIDSYDGYDIAWADEKAEKEAKFAFDFYNDTVTIKSLAGTSGTLRLAVSNDNWRTSINTSLKVKVLKTPVLDVRMRKVIMNVSEGNETSVVIPIAVKDNPTIKVKNAVLSDGKNASKYLNNLDQSFNEYSSKMTISLNSVPKIITKDVSEKYKLTVTVGDDSYSKDIVTDVTVKYTKKNVSMKLKTSGSIDSSNRTNSGVICTKSLTNASGDIVKVSISGNDAKYFNARLVTNKNGNQVKITAKTRMSEDMEGLKTGREYLVDVICELDNGLKYSCKDVKIPVAKRTVKIDYKPSKIELYSSSLGEKNGKTVSFSITKPKNLSIKNLELSNYQDIFDVSQNEDGSAVIYVKNSTKFAKKTEYSVKMNLQIVDKYEGVTNTTAKLSIKRIKAVPAENAGNRSAFVLNTTKFNYYDDEKAYHIENAISAINGKLRSGIDIKEAQYKFLDNKDHMVSAGKIAIDENGYWKIDNPKMWAGETYLELIGVDNDGKEYSDLYKFFNLSKENLIDVDENADADSDGLPDFLENYFETDKNNPDTDGDGLSDSLEALEVGTDPTKKDTDNNGIADGDEDRDNDGLTNLDECTIYGTSLISLDTDMDGLTDLEEIETYGTDPKVEDTDGDGASDSQEIKYGFDPNEYNPSFNVEYQCPGRKVSAKVKINDLSAEQLDSFHVERLSNDSLLDIGIPGFIDCGYDFSFDGGLPAEAEISFVYSDKVKADQNGLFDPVIYHFDEENQTLNPVPGSSHTDAINEVAATVTHFSKYILIDKNQYEQENETVLVEQKEGVRNSIATQRASLTLNGNEDEYALEDAIVSKRILSGSNKATVLTLDAGKIDGEDKNEDGIPDYYEKVLCESKPIINGIFINPFSGVPYELLMQRGADFDGDGLTNGEEVYIGKILGVLSIINGSDPFTKYSDTDLYDDYEEQCLGTSRTVPSLVLKGDDMKVLLEDDQYSICKYVKDYDDSVLTWLDNMWRVCIVGTNWDYEYLYRCGLMEYIETTGREMSSENGTAHELIKLTVQIQANMWAALRKVESEEEKFAIIKACEELDEEIEELCIQCDEKFESTMDIAEHIYKISDITYETFELIDDFYELIKDSEVALEAAGFAALKKGGFIVGVVLEIVDITLNSINVVNMLDEFTEFVAAMEEVDSTIESLKYAKDHLDDSFSNDGKLCNAISNVIVAIRTKAFPVGSGAVWESVWVSAPGVFLFLVEAGLGAFVGGVAMFVCLALYAAAMITLGIIDAVKDISENAFKRMKAYAVAKCVMKYKGKLSGTLYPSGIKKKQYSNVTVEWEDNCKNVAKMIIHTSSQRTYSEYEYVRTDNSLVTKQFKSLMVACKGIRRDPKISYAWGK